MGMMKHKHTCLIMAMMSYNNTNNKVLNNMPKEVLEHIVGFIAGHQSGAACNALKLKTIESAVPPCCLCWRLMKRGSLKARYAPIRSDSDLESDLDEGESPKAAMCKFFCTEGEASACRQILASIMRLQKWQWVIYLWCFRNGVKIGRG